MVDSIHANHVWAADHTVLCTLWNWILFVIDHKRVDLIWRVPDSRADIVKDYCAYQAMHSLYSAEERNHEKDHDGSRWFLLQFSRLSEIGIDFVVPCP